MTLHQLLVLNAERVMDLSSEQPYSTQPSAKEAQVPIPVLFFLSLMSSPFCVLQRCGCLSFLEAHFQSLVPPSPSFFPIQLSQATEDGESEAEGLHSSSLPACCQGVKTR